MNAAAIAVAKVGAKFREKTGLAVITIERFIDRLFLELLVDFHPA